jgi:hypothetical protein
MVAVPVEGEHHAGGAGGARPPARRLARILRVEACIAQPWHSWEV